MTQGVQQEMLKREQPQQKQQQQPPQEQEVKQEPEEIKFGGGSGGGGKPFIRFGSSSSFSSVVCRPDPERPGHQICKKVVRESKLDPLTGQRTERNLEKEEDGGPLSIGSFFGLPGSIRGRQADESIANQQRQSDGSQQVANRMHEFVDRGQKTYDQGRSMFERFSDLMHFGQKHFYGGHDEHQDNHIDDEEEYYEYYDDSKRNPPQTPATGFIDHPQEEGFFETLDDLERDMMDSFFGRSGFGGPHMGSPFGGSGPFGQGDPFGRSQRSDFMGGFGGAPSRRHESFADNLHRNLLDEIEREMLGRSMHRPDVHYRYQQQGPPEASFRQWEQMKPQEEQKPKTKIGKGKIFEV